MKTMKCMMWLASVPSAVASVDVNVGTSLDSLDEWRARRERCGRSEASVDSREGVSSYLERMIPRVLENRSESVVAINVDKVIRRVNIQRRIITSSRIPTRGETSGKC